MDVRDLLEDSSLLAVLAERARMLARQEDLLANEFGAAMLSFRLGSDIYSLPAAAVREVQPLGRYTRLPAVPPFVVGLVNVRGRLITAIDLRVLLGLASTPISPTMQLLIIAIDDHELGIVADLVMSVHHEQAELAPAPSQAAGRSISWVRGIDAEFSIHLDPELLFADPTLVVNSEADGAG